MPAPVKHTCPDIDKAIKKVAAALKIASAGRKSHDKGTDDYDNYDAIEDCLMYLEGDLEDLRSANDALRTWGTDMEKERDNFESNLYDLEK